MPAPKPVVVGLALYKPDPTAKDGAAFAPGRLGGMEIHLMLEDKVRTFISLDMEGSTLTALADDKGGNLLTSRGRLDLGGATIDPFPLISPDGHRLTLSVGTRQLPSAGATQINLAGQLAVLAGGPIKTLTFKDVTLQRGAKFDIPGLALQIQELAGRDAAEGLSTEITFSSPANLDRIRALRYLDSAGKVAVASAGNSSRTALPAGYTRTFTLKGKIEKTTLETDHYLIIEKLTLPMDLTVTLGLDAIHSNSKTTGAESGPR